MTRNAQKMAIKIKLIRIEKIKNKEHKVDLKRLVNDDISNAQYYCILLWQVLVTRTRSVSRKLRLLYP